LHWKFFADEYVVFARSLDSGATFPSMYLLGDITYYGAYIAVTSIVTRPGPPPIVSVLFDDAGTTIYYRRSEDGGASFHPPLPLSTNAAVGSGTVASYYDYTVHVAYEELGGGLFYTRGTDYGATFDQPPQKLSDIRRNDIGERISAVENNVYVVWKGLSL
jgi:hypothetical protein